jgi:hypothetical protein
MEALQKWAGTSASGLQLDPQQAHEELYRQATVMTWTSLEVLMNDLVAHWLNETPKLGASLEEIKKIPIGDLEIYGYDLSKRMGDFYISKHGMATGVFAIKKVVNLLKPTDKASPNATLGQLLDSPELRLLSERRHLIVHRAGVVDQKYVKNTKDKFSIGSILVVEANQLQIQMAAAIEAGMAALVI